MAALPSSVSAVEEFGKSELASFVASRKRAILLVGSTSRATFLKPIVEHFSRQYGRDIRFGFLRIGDLGERASLMPQVARAFAQKRRRPRAAPCGYYLFVGGQAKMFHPGLNDPRLGPVVAAAAAQKAPIQALQCFQRAMEDVSLAIIACFERLLCPSSPGVRRPVGDPYLVLGVSHNASDADIKRTFRELLRATHPDQFSAEGAEAQRLATERTQAIIRAYRQIKESRGKRGGPGTLLA